MLIMLILQLLLLKMAIIVAAVEEFNRVKHLYQVFHINSILFCLEKEGIQINDIDYITTNSNPF